MKVSEHGNLEKDGSHSRFGLCQLQNHGGRGQQSGNSILSHDVEIQKTAC